MGKGDLGQKQAHFGLTSLSQHPGGEGVGCPGRRPGAREMEEGRVGGGESPGRQEAPRQHSESRGPERWRRSWGEVCPGSAGN